VLARGGANVVDMILRRHYRNAVGNTVIIIARILIVTFLAVLAATTVSHAAMATQMPIEAALACSSAVDIADCKGCGEDSRGGAGCDIVCMALFGAIVDADQVYKARTAITERALGFRVIAEPNRPPDPFPPRSFALG
jgi:hypothetical protein